MDSNEPTRGPRLERTYARPAWRRHSRDIFLNENGNSAWVVGHPTEWCPQQEGLLLAGQEPVQTPRAVESGLSSSSSLIPETAGDRAHHMAVVMDGLPGDVGWSFQSGCGDSVSDRLKDDTSPCWEGGYGVPAEANRRCDLSDDSGEGKGEELRGASHVHSSGLFRTEERWETLPESDVDDKKYPTEPGPSGAINCWTATNPGSGASQTENGPFLVREKEQSGSDDESVVVLSSQDQASEGQEDAFEELFVGLEEEEMSDFLPGSEDDGASLESDPAGQSSSSDEGHVDPDYLDEDSLLSEQPSIADFEEPRRNEPECGSKQRLISDLSAPPSGRSDSHSASTGCASSGDFLCWTLQPSFVNPCSSSDFCLAEYRDSAGQGLQPSREETRSQSGECCLLQSSVCTADRDSFPPPGLVSAAMGMSCARSNSEPHVRTGLDHAVPSSLERHVSLSRRSAAACVSAANNTKKIHGVQQSPGVFSERGCSATESRCTGLGFACRSGEHAFSSISFACNDCHESQSLSIPLPATASDADPLGSHARAPRLVVTPEFAPLSDQKGKYKRPKRCDGMAFPRQELPTGRGGCCQVAGGQEIMSERRVAGFLVDVPKNKSPSSLERSSQEIEHSKEEQAGTRSRGRCYMARAGLRARDGSCREVVSVVPGCFGHDKEGCRQKESKHEVERRDDKGPTNGMLHKQEKAILKKESSVEGGQVEEHPQVVGRGGHKRNSDTEKRPKCWGETTAVMGPELGIRHGVRVTLSGSDMQEGSIEALQLPSNFVQFSLASEQERGKAENPETKTRPRRYRTKRNRGTRARERLVMACAVATPSSRLCALPECSMVDTCVRQGFPTVVLRQGKRREWQAKSGVAHRDSSIEIRTACLRETLCPLFFKRGFLGPSDRLHKESEERTTAGCLQYDVGQKEHDSNVPDELQAVDARRGVKSASCISSAWQLVKQEGIVRPKRQIKQTEVSCCREHVWHVVDFRKNQAGNGGTMEGKQRWQFPLRRVAITDNGDVAHSSAEGAHYQLFTNRRVSRGIDGTTVNGQDVTENAMEVDGLPEANLRAYKHDTSGDTAVLQPAQTTKRKAAERGASQARGAEDGQAERDCGDQLGCVVKVKIQIGEGANRRQRHDGRGHEGAKGKGRRYPVQGVSEGKLSARMDEEGGFEGEAMKVRKREPSDGITGPREVNGHRNIFEIDVRRNHKVGEEAAGADMFGQEPVSAQKVIGERAAVCGVFKGDKRGKKEAHAKLFLHYECNRAISLEEYTEKRRWNCEVGRKRFPSERRSAVGQSRSQELRPQNDDGSSSRAANTPEATLADKSLFASRPCLSRKKREGHVQTRRCREGWVENGPRFGNEFEGVIEGGEEERRRRRTYCLSEKPRKKRRLVGLQSEDGARRPLPLFDGTVVQPSAVVNPDPLMPAIQLWKSGPHYRSCTESSWFRDYLRCMRQHNAGSFRTDLGAKKLGDLSQHERHHVPTAVEKYLDGGGMPREAELGACRQHTASEQASLTPEGWCNVFLNKGQNAGHFDSTETQSQWLATPAAGDKSSEHGFSAREVKPALHLCPEHLEPFGGWFLTPTRQQDHGVSDWTGCAGKKVVGQGDQKGFHFRLLYLRSSKLARTSGKGPPSRLAAVLRPVRAAACRNPGDDTLSGVHEQARSTGTLGEFKPVESGEAEDEAPAEQRGQGCRAKFPEVEQRSYEKRPHWGSHTPTTKLVQTLSLGAGETSGGPTGEASSYTRSAEVKETELAAFLGSVSPDKIPGATGHCFGGSKDVFATRSPDQRASFPYWPRGNRITSADIRFLVENGRAAAKQPAPQLVKCLWGEDTSKGAETEEHDRGSSGGTRERVFAHLYVERKGEADGLISRHKASEAGASGYSSPEAEPHCSREAGHAEKRRDEEQQARVVKRTERHRPKQKRRLEKFSLSGISQHPLTARDDPLPGSLEKEVREAAFRPGATPEGRSQAKLAKRFEEQLPGKGTTKRGQADTSRGKETQQGNTVCTWNETTDIFRTTAEGMPRLRRRGGEKENEAGSENQISEEGLLFSLEQKTREEDPEGNHAQKGSGEQARPQQKGQSRQLQEGERPKVWRRGEQKLRREARQPSCLEYSMERRHSEQDTSALHSKCSITQRQWEQESQESFTHESLEKQEEEQQGVNRPEETEEIQGCRRHRGHGVDRSPREHNSFQQLSTASFVKPAQAPEYLEKHELVACYSEPNLRSTGKERQSGRRGQRTSFQSASLSFVRSASNEERLLTMPPPSFAPTGVFQGIPQRSFWGSRRFTAGSLRREPEGVLTEPEGSGVWLSVWHWTVWTAMIVLQWSWWRVNAAWI